MRYVIAGVLLLVICVGAMLTYFSENDEASLDGTEIAAGTTPDDAVRAPARRLSRVFLTARVVGQDGRVVPGGSCRVELAEGSGAGRWRGEFAGRDPFRVR